MRNSISPEGRPANDYLNKTISAGPPYDVGVNDIVKVGLGRNRGFGIDTYEAPKNEKLLIASKSYTV